MEYRFAGIDVAMQILRPGATFEISGLTITNWDDPRPKPTTEEIVEMVESIKKFEEAKIISVFDGNESNEVSIDKFFEDHENYNK
jgi:hypothetical protein